MIATIVYHRVSDDRWPDPFQQAVSLNNLHSQLDSISDFAVALHPREFGSEALCDLVSDSRVYFLITIDDGYAPSSKLIQSACASRGIVPILFVSVGHLGCSEHYWWDCLSAGPGSLEDLKQMQAELMQLPYREAAEQVGCPGSCPGDREPLLSFKELRGLTNDVEIGVHGYWHESPFVVGSMTSVACLADAVGLLRAHGIFSRSYAFPFGIGWNLEFSERLGEYFSASFVAQNEIASAGLLRRPHWRHALPRFYGVDQPGGKLVNRITRAMSRTEGAAT